MTGKLRRAVEGSSDYARQTTIDSSSHGSDPPPLKKNLNKLQPTDREDTRSVKELLGERRCLTNRQLDHVLENRPKNKEWRTQNQRRVLWRTEDEFKNLGQEQAEIESRQSLSDRRSDQ